MKLFGRTGGHWIFYISSLYFVSGMWSIYKGVDTLWLGPMYVLFLSMPFWFPPLGRSMNLDVNWDRKMFEWYNKKYQTSKYPTWETVTPPETGENMSEDTLKEKVDDPCYQVGKTTDGRVTLRLGNVYQFSTITMNNQGVDTLIRMLQAAKEDSGIDLEPTND